MRLKDIHVTGSMQNVRISLQIALTGLNVKCAAMSEVNKYIQYMILKNKMQSNQKYRIKYILKLTYFAETFA